MAFRIPHRDITPELAQLVYRREQTGEDENGAPIFTRRLQVGIDLGDRKPRGVNLTVPEAKGVVSQADWSGFLAVVSALEALAIDRFKVAGAIEEIADPPAE